MGVEWTSKMPKRESGSHNVCNYLSTLEAAGIAAVNPAAFLSEISSLKHDRFVEPNPVRRHVE